MVATTMSSGENNPMYQPNERAKIPRCPIATATQISDLDNRQAAYRHYREELDKPEPRLT